MISSNKAILVGQVISVHGINGAIKIRSYTEEPKNLFLYQIFLENKTLLKLEYLFTKLPNLICKTSEINSRNEAEKLVGLKIFTYRELLPETLNEDEFYLIDLLNLDIFDKDNNKIGKINNIFNYGAGDLVEIKFLDDSSEILKFTKKNFPIIHKEYLVLDLDFKNE